jgi:excisionase family DNA binding protein
MIKYDEHIERYTIMGHSGILTLNELCRYLKIPKPTLYRLSENGTIPSFKVGKQLRFRKKAIDKWIDRQEVTKRKRGHIKRPITRSKG